MSHPLCQKWSTVLSGTLEIAQICYNIGHACFNKDRFIPQLDVINLSSVEVNASKRRKSGNSGVVSKRRA